jgi:DnaJ like chaperone protein
MRPAFKGTKVRVTIVSNAMTRALRLFGFGYTPTSPENDVAFTMAVVALGAKLAQADGKATIEEVVAFQTVFRPPPGAERQVRRFFDLARQSTRGFDAYAKKIPRRWRHMPEVLENVVDGLFFIAAADGHLDGRELEFLAEVSRDFGLTDACFERLRAQWIPGETNPYALLGVATTATRDDIKAAYRKLAKANHPDRFSGRGMPATAEVIAQSKMAAINAAYQRLMKVAS